MTSAAWQNRNSFQISDFSAEMERQLTKLRDKFRASLVERILAYEEMRQQLQSNQNSESALKGIFDLSHKISGVARTLGFPVIGESSSEIERRIVAGHAMGSSVHEICCDILPALEELLDEMEGLLDK